MISFAGWLLNQKSRDGWIGDLARAAAADPRFPKTADVKAVYARLNELEADGEMYQAIEDAESEWMSASGDA